MAENWVRCRRCYEVFDAGEGPCPKCGTPSEPPAPQPRPIEGLYTERYAEQAAPADMAGRAEAPGVKIAAGPRPRRRASRPTLLIGAGAVLIVGAVVVALVAGLGGGATPTRAPVFVHEAETIQPLQPTLPPILALALRYVANYNLDAHVTIQATVQLSSQVKWKTQSLTTKFDGHVSQGNQSGTLQTGGTSQEIRMIGGLFFVRTMPSGKWSILAGLPTYLLVSPILGISSTQDLKSEGPTMREGQITNHLQSTSAWAPDISRLTMTDLSSLPIQPTEMVLDLWVDDNGVPLSATVSATNMGSGGAKLLDIRVTYTFTDVGVPTKMVAPISPSPAPSPTATPGS
jgi:hypothetical protein